MGFTNPWSDLSVKKLFKRDSIVIDDFVFRLHHQFNFFLLGIGVLFIFAENYLDGKAIVCRRADEYTTKFCWLHGTGYINDKLAEDMWGESERSQACRVRSDGVNQDNNRLTSYYIWLPFLLLVCMGLAKLARLVWKEWMEGGLLRSILLRRSTDETLCGVKISEEFRKRKYRVIMWKFFLCYVLCEMINLVSVIVMMVIFDHVLIGQFFAYGSQYVNYKASSETDEMNNPMCELFPTVVACNFRSIGNNGSPEDESYLCLLSNNLFNQYYFMILWFWWVLLIVISVANLFVRFAELLVPSFQSGSKQLSQKTTIPERFVLRFMNENLEPGVYDQVCMELEKCGSKDVFSSSVEEEKLV